MNERRIPLKIGILGAARIARRAIVYPAQASEHVLYGVASRDRARGEAFAKQFAVERVYDSYQGIIDDPAITVIYNALPNNGHAPWNIKALQAGKHVLSEKPAASNALEARLIQDVVRGQSKIYMEAFHYFYHPVIQRILEILTSGEIGDLVSVKTALYGTMPDKDDLRLQFDLAGGCLMDMGCYSVHSQRMISLALFGGEPEVVSAKARLNRPNVDEALEVRLKYANGAVGVADCDFDTEGFNAPMIIRGSKGSIETYSFVVPSWDDRVVIRVGSLERTEYLGTTSSYTYQLQAFADAVDFGRPFVTNAADSTANMAIIDQAYLAAGLDIRPAVKL
jgi:predicted dehydrogenase